MSELNMAGDRSSSMADDPARPRTRTPQARSVGNRGGAPRVSGRNEAPTRHNPNQNTRPAPGRSAPPRNLPPNQASRPDGTVTAERPIIPAAREETVELRPLPPAAAPEGVAADPPAEHDRRARPAPDDAAAEVWAMVERAQGGDKQAFAQIYDRYFETVFRFIYFRVGNRPTAEDLTSETFMRALKRIGSFTWQGRDLGAWLVTIARNLVADHFKSGRYRLEVSAGNVLDADQADRGPEGSPEAAVVSHITNMTLLAAVKQLNPEQRDCIVLRFLLGFSVAETAQAMGKNEGAIKALQYRAVRAVHRLLPEGFRP